jgi:hypothetical protein
MTAKERRGFNCPLRSLLEQEDLVDLNVRSPWSFSEMLDTSSALSLYCGPPNVGNGNRVDLIT